MSNRLFYDPNTERPYIGVRLPAQQLADLDRARLDLRLSRSEFLRRAIAAQLQQLRAAPK
ncbi:ribbon-helix-helix protein, CopG family [Bradyrhizobium ottawaense]|uniref:ribbon-helix-helix protein, CopG family n=1 Tax=Bradyrhizobium ottawaense TaxID=931866 RepID=UPI001BA880A1|nr:ribbon-helix-helix protein, CopG family [Bradyrhizobium ottawaense]MBR1366356.1 ribbon-helix-helix protein, CopG family [Bradyrhizobium ottawaense]